MLSQNKDQLLTRWRALSGKHDNVAHNGCNASRRRLGLKRQRALAVLGDSGW